MSVLRGCCLLRWQGPYGWCLGYDCASLRVVRCLVTNEGSGVICLLVTGSVDFRVGAL